MYQANTRIYALFTLVASLLFSGCASVHYANDYKSGTQFNNLKTYNWRAITLDIGGTDQALLTRLADKQLATQGFILDKNQPQLLLDLQVFSRQSQSGNSSIGIGIGMPVGRHGSVGLGTSQLLNRGKQEGVMLIDVTRASDNTLIWRGSAEGIPLIQFSLSAEQKLGDTMAQLLGQFPPKVAP
ncbi:DUF4136 domain-containing protein [Cellvibrio fontiphilus]|uniref:DUF4136 domain-containing protein n=1 Tax=Cellvibrio fontiphilus TaxID=1815559 RepID=A0ABV7FE80_9GAMM